MLELKAKDITSIIISHKLNEISRVADGVTVIRDGTTVDVIDCRESPLNESRVVQAMVGRELADRYPGREPNLGDKQFEVEHWSVEHPERPGEDFIRDVSFLLAKVRWLGLPGLWGWPNRTCHEHLWRFFWEEYSRHCSPQWPGITRAKRS